MKKTVLAVVLLFMLGTVAQAIDISTEFGQGADGHIGNDTSLRSTVTSGSSATALQSRYNGGGSRFRCTYLRFDVSEYNDDYTGSTLMFDATYIKSSTGRRLDVYGLVDETLDAWTESALCYQNAPGMLQPETGWDTGNYLLDTAKLVWLGYFVTPGTSQYPSPTYPIRFSSDTTNLGTLFSDFLNADTNGLVTLVVINSTGTSGVNSEDTFASKEHATFLAPTLVVPEPATMLLLGLGGLLFVRRKK